MRRSMWYITRGREKVCPPDWRSSAASPQQPNLGSYSLVPRESTLATATFRGARSLSLLGILMANCGLAVGGEVTSAARSERPPNVIIIFTDDQGSLDMGCYGSLDLKTPHMDALADRGIRFTQFYAAAPVCSPSRAGLLTGRYPKRAGVPGNVSSMHGKPGMPPEQLTIAELLKEAGYATAHVGKWHLGYNEDTMPNNQGFDYSFGHMGGCIDNYSHFFYWNGPNRHDLWRQGQEVFEDSKYFPELMVAEASTFMDRHRDHPFFIYFAMNVPHYPYQGHARWLEYYREEQVEYPRDLYNAFVSTQDEYVGKLVAKVDELGLRGETIIIFQSDHGHSTEQRAHHGGGNAGPFRGAKFSLFEGGIRVPAIISWPGQLAEGRVERRVAHSCDWMPTIAAACGIELADTDVDGKNILPMIRDNASSPHKLLHWTIGNSWAVRDGDWKLLGNPRDTSNKGPLDEGDQLFLVHLARDEGEMKNVAQEQPEIVKRLKRVHDEWSASVSESE